MQQHQQQPLQTQPGVVHAPAPAQMEMPAPPAEAPANAPYVFGAAPVPESPFVAGVLTVPARRKSAQPDAPAQEPAAPEKRRELARTATDEENAAFLKKRSLDWEAEPLPTEAQMQAQQVAAIAAPLA